MKSTDLQSFNERDANNLYESLITIDEESKIFLKDKEELNAVIYTFITLIKDDVRSLLRNKTIHDIRIEKEESLDSLVFNVRYTENNLEMINAINNFRSKLAKIYAESESDIETKITMADQFLIDMEKI